MFQQKENFSASVKVIGLQQKEISLYKQGFLRAEKTRQNGSANAAPPANRVTKRAKPGCDGSDNDDAPDANAPFVQTSVLLKRHGSDIADVEKDFAEAVLENTKDNLIPIVVPRFGPFGECAQLGKTICESRQLEHTTVDLCCHSYLVCTTASSQNRFSICLQFRLRYGRITCG
jgi:hypothetical protein